MTPINTAEIPVSNPEQQFIGEEILTEAERHKILHEWNKTTTEYPHDRCIHQLFEEQVERTPDAVAVVFESEQLTYLELNARANQLAHYLQVLGVGPEVLVGICVERSFEMIVGLLGVLKAGGAYVPLDPAYPFERLGFMLEDSSVPVLLTQSKLAEELPSHSARVVYLDKDWEEIAFQSEENLHSSVAPNNLAYVIYTSGSTGRPKGVAIEHHSTVAFLTWAEEIFTPEDITGILASTSICFDLSVFELFVPLCRGGKVILAENALALPTLADASEITLINTVPSAIAELVRLKGIPAGVRTINLAGEALSNKLVQQLYEQTNVRQVFNLYGPSEDTTYSTVALVEKGARIVTIGRPISNTQIYILDSYLQPVPIGVPGELYIGGDGLARGYLNRSDLTDEKFIPNPFKNQSNSRLYKTGDLARYLPDGNIEYLGRIDNQVKIRGFRIELGEIEAVLSQHPNIRETAVIASENIAGDKQLVAYVVPHQEGALTISDLRRFLKEQLPDYMVPSAFVVLEALPLTPNGKVDRRALRAPEKRPELEESFVAPRTPIEEILTTIWGNILSIGFVGIHDNFFELGGHSLLATQVISRVRDTFGIELPLRSLFEAPTIAEFATKVENSLNNGQSVEALPLVPISRSEPIPLSFAQARLWFLDQLQPESAFYNIPLALHLSGQLNIAALQRAINEIIQRHEALRTNFTTIEGQPVQVIASSLNCELQVVNLLHIRESDREIEAQQLALAEANRPFNLEREPLLRGTVLQLGETEYVLLLTMHHIISDGWSLGVFVKELTELYTDFCSGKSPSLPKLPIQYADFSLWQRQWLTGEILETQLDYWKEQLLDAPALLELPTDRPRPTIQTFRGAHQSLAISQKLSLALVAYSKRVGVTLFMLLVAAFQTLLYRYTGQDDILVGTPVANRNRQEIEGLIGFFVNTLVLRTDLSGNPTFEQLLNRVREVALGAYAHQDLPFEQLVEALHPTRDLSYTPLFQVMFALEDALVPSVELPELSISSYPVEIGTAKFDLTLSMENRADGLVAEWEYNTDLFDEDTITRMSRHFQTLLEGIVANPIQSISELPLLTQAQQHQLLFEWNNTWAEFPQNKCIHQLFEQQVELSPDAIAVVFENQQLTYQELNAKANQLAHYLQTLGVKPEVLVGICIERSLEMIVGLLGILKAGGAYVPLDPAYPSERLAFMLEDSAVPVLLTQQRLVDRLPQHQAQLVCLDKQWEAIAQYSEENIACGVQSDNLAYVIYTSGSTGKPKGVTIQHQSLVNYVNAVTIEYEIEKTDRILQFASISFDASAEEIYPCLTSGATLVLRTDSMLDSFDNFLKKCSTCNLTVLSLPTAYWHELTARLSQENLVFPPSLRLVIIGGEKALLERLKTWQECVGQQVRLVNTYGPTEATVVATIYDLSKTSPTLTHLPIGRPICNVQTYILDRYLQPVPVGVPGELHIGGVGLARGYLNRPDLTNEKFIPNPFSNDPNSRLYKTGDLARYLPDGNIEFLGRVDNQVKIRGFRIELGEIEAALAQHPAIGETAVIANENITGNQQLVAYFVPKAEVKPSINDLRHFLKHQLPDYMIPSVFVTLEHLPLTQNGKIDHRALPVPEIRPELELTFVAPRTPLEEILANLWAEVLGLKQIGIYDNFFSLGGHSLLATQIISKISTNLGIEIPLRHLFEFPTIAELAEEIEVLLGSEQSAQRIPILPIQRTTEIPLSFAQARLWFLDQLQPESAFYNIPHIFRLHGQLNIKILENSLNEIIRRHEALRTNFTTNDGNPVQIIRPYLHLELLILNVLDLSDEARESEAQRLVNQFANQPFNLQNEPLIRSYLLQLGEQDYIFVLVLHHIVADGWSMEILERELSTIYTALCNHQTPALPELPIQYADFSVWQRDWLAGEIFQRQLNYWQQQLQGIPSLLELPTDRPRPAIQTYRGAHQSFQLSTELSEAIISLSKRRGVTPFMLLLAAFQILLYRYTGQDDIVVGTPIANRHYRDIEGLIGFFVNTLALRANNFSLNPSFEYLLSQVREVTLGAYAHQDMPFDELVEALQPERSLSHSPIFQVMFGVENESIFNFSLPQLKVSPLTAESRSAKFDLDLSLQNTPKGWIGIWEYNTDLFDGTTIARMTEHFQTLLAGIVTNPKTLISELPLLTATQQHQLLVEWNHTQKDYPFDKCIHQLFEAQVKLTPDAVAVVIEGEQLTYRELNARANQLAHYLQTLGVKAEVLVGICIERSLEMVVGLLGILKAGGAYVPIDPAYPSERKAFILEDTTVPVVLTQFRFVESLPQHQTRVVCLDCDWEEISQYSEDNPTCKVIPDNLAYVIYTSGSTGQPKGVLIEHQALVNHSVSVAKHYDLQVTDRVLQFASISFDVAAEELFPTWIGGGTVVLRPGSTPPTIAEFQELINREKLTVLNLSASYWHEWVSVRENSEIQLPSSLRLVVVGNEKVLPDKLINWQKIVGNRIRWINAYGLTETTITSTIYEPDIWQEKNSADIKAVSIGRPIANTQVYVLDAHLEPVPIGVPGELHIGGAGLARGYLNRPDLTAEKFISNPFSSNSKARLYKTGDKVRYLPDGNIEYLGRIDNQVKIRGFRIELGEIETVLNSHPAVQEAVVIEREDIPGQKRLVAYLVAKQQNKEIEFWPSVGEYPLYDELLYHAMTNDLPRNQSYQRAINALVRDKVVVEIGTGKDAILARLCVEAGAKKVYAIEASKQAYDSALALVKDLGLSEKIILIHGYSTAVDLPEKVDVCVSEIIGTIGGSEGVVPILQDSQRFLKENGSMIPYRSVTKIAAVSLPEQLRENFAFNEVPAHYVSQVFEHVGRPFDLRLCIKNFPLKNIISNSAIFEELVFTNDADNEYSLNISLKIQKSGKLDGFLLWLNLYVSPHEVIDNLKQEGSNWLPVYFPVFYPALDVNPGDTIEAICTSQLSDNNINPDYRIEGKLIRQNGKVISFAFDSFHHQQPTRRSPFYELLFPSGKIERNKDSGNLSVQNIRAFISSHLPDYMIPSAFVTIPALPLTPNGKVDRRQLPVPTENPSGMIEPKSAPSSPTEILVSQIWAELLGLKQVRVNDNFFELGGNSLLVIRLLSQLHQVCGVDIPIHRLFEFPTVAGIAQLIDKSRLVGTIDNLAENILDLSAEAVLEEEIRPQSLTFNEVSEPKCIFLTDATGFVGSYLLYELLQQTTADIYCLVNASNSDEAKNRLQTQLEFYSLWQSSFSSRILPVIGNLSQPLLGITTAKFENLANQIDVIYHSGECNNVIYPYAALKAVNVTATQEVLRLASQIKIKPVHFISTLGVFYSPHYFQRQLIAESDPLDCSQGLTSGYGQSKWVAEKLMMMARERGLPVCIYRLGRFAGHSQTGAVATDDWLFRMIKGCIQLGMFPESEMMIEMIPIDYVSKAIVCISQAKSSLGKAFHITNHHQISWEYLTNWIQKFGYPVQRVSFEKWHEELISHLNYFPENALHSLLPLFPKESDSQKIEFKFDNQNTLEALSGTEICCPPLNAELLNIYFSYFLKIGFLSAPESTTVV